MQNGSCAVVFSQPYKITVSQLAGGTLNGPTAVCQTQNTGTLSLQNYLGNIIRWESSSSEDFASGLQPITLTTNAYTFTNLSADTWFRVVVGNADCGETFSASWKVGVDLPSLGGEIAGALSFCSTQNSGTLTLQNQRGSILRWEALK